MKKKFEQLSNKPSYMKNNGGLLFRSINKKKFEFKTKIKKTHLNKAGITHGGYICTIIDAGAGTACHRASGNKPCVTISVDIKFIALDPEGTFKNIETIQDLVLNKFASLEILKLWFESYKKSGKMVFFRLIDREESIEIIKNSHERWKHLSK